MKILRLALAVSAVFLMVQIALAADEAERLVVSGNSQSDLPKRVMALMLARASMPYPADISPKLQKAFDYADHLESSRDLEESQKLMLECANDGDPLAQYVLGLRYLLSPTDNLDKQSAYYWLNKAADQGMPDARFWMAYMLANGIGAEKNNQAAADWLAFAARSGSLLAQRILKGETVLQAFSLYLKDARH